MVNRPFAKALHQARSFLGRLARNTAGNVLAIVAATLPPILILVGGGVDMSRAYMAQTSLQNACDAGVLAGRRAQAKSGAWGTAEQAKAQKMFAINYQAAAANASSTSLTLSNPSTGVISGVATSTIPTTIMKIFGTNTFTLTANCSAEFQVSNIDVMMVLDTTGSMARCPDGSWCNSGAGSKIEGLKSAVRSFYYTIAAAVPSGSTTRVRFGFVPYNGMVNLSDLMTGTSPVIPQSYLASSANYQTKLYRFDQPIYTSSTSSPVVTYETYGGTPGTPISQADCNNYGINAYPSSGTNPVTTGTRPNPVHTSTYAYSSWVSNCGNCQGNSGNGKGNIATGICTRQVSTITTTYTVTAYGLNPTTPYRYTQAALDTSNARAMTAVTIATGVDTTSTVPAAGYTSGWYDMITLGSLTGKANVTTSSMTWNGCIEERSTVNTLFTNSTAPSGALDHDIVNAPTNAASSWKPVLDKLEYWRSTAAPIDTADLYWSEWDYQINYGRRICPPAAKNFTTVDTSAPTTVPGWLETYLGTLTANGNTYHDVGMIWGARLANPSGINSAVVNSGTVTSISRHILFLTDGDMEPNRDTYSTYGLEFLDNRVAPATTDNATLKSYHNARFLTACKKAKDMGYTVWVVGFGQALTTEMTACAGNGGTAMYANSTSALQTNFRDIASRIANLRLRT